MVGLIKNEIEKLLGKKKIFIMIIIIMVIGFAGFAARMKDNEVQLPKNRLKTLENRISDYEAKIKENKVSKSEKSKLNQLIYADKEEIKTIQDSTDSNISQKQKLKNEIAGLKEQANNEKLTLSSSETEKINSKIKIDKYYLAKNINPDKSYAMTSFSSFYYIMYFINAIGVIIVTVFLMSDIVSSEYMPPTIKLLISKPVSRAKIIVSKFIAGVLSSIGIIISIEIIGFLVVGIIYGFGNPFMQEAVGGRFKYDNLKNLNLVVGSTQLISEWQLVVRMLVFQIIYIIACCSFCLLISTIVKNNTNSLSLAFILLIGALIGGKVMDFGEIKPFIITSYNNILAVMKNETALLSNNEYLTTLNGGIFLVALSTICIILAIKIFEKRDILA